MAINIRRATIRDTSALTRLERSCPTAAHWSEQQYRECLQSEGQDGRLVQVAEKAAGEGIPAGTDETVAFLIARQTADGWELENIVVAPAEQRKGIGAALLVVFFSQARQTDNKAVFLEVRASNAAAQALYQEHGFRQTGRRKSYYQNPLEDAILYRLDLS